MTPERREYIAAVYRRAAHAIEENSTEHYTFGAGALGCCDVIADITRADNGHMDNTLRVCSVSILFRRIFRPHPKTTYWFGDPEVSNSGPRALACYFAAEFVASGDADDL